MKMDSEGEHYAQGEGFQALSGVRVEHRTGTEAHIGHRQHLRSEGEKQVLHSITVGTVSTASLLPLRIRVAVQISPKNFRCYVVYSCQGLTNVKKRKAVSCLTISLFFV